MNSNHAKILDQFLRDMLESSIDKGFAGFFYRSRASVMVVLLIIRASINKEDISFEEICITIPKHFASRTTIKSILDQGVKLNYFTKETPLDSRKRFYEPSVSTKKFMVNWIKRNSEIFKLNI